MIRLRLTFLAILATCVSASGFASQSVDQTKLKDAVDQTILPLMRERKIPGMAVAVTIRGKRYFFNYGLASRDTKRRVSSDTLFEIGSISKTFTATLASYAQITGSLSLADSVTKYLPELRGSSFDQVRLINLATHTAGGLPLQVPSEIHSMAQLMDYLKRWQPKTVVGASRTYSNISIGLLGVITAKSIGRPFEQLIERNLFSPLGMKESYYHVPPGRMTRYAQGYTGKDEPIRMCPGVLGSEAYGVKSCAADLIRFVEANLQVGPDSGVLARAISATHTAYFTSGEIMQDLIWEQYPYPVELKRLLAGNSTKMISEANAAIELAKPFSPQAEVLINKTGSTNGFGCYVAFIPSRKIGIVLLANKSYPIPARVTAAFRILTSVGHPVL